MILRFRFWLAQILLGCPDGWLFDAMWMMPFEENAEQRKSRKDDVRNVARPIEGIAPFEGKAADWLVNYLKTTQPDPKKQREQEEKDQMTLGGVPVSDDLAHQLLTIYFAEHFR